MGIRVNGGASGNKENDSAPVDAVLAELRALRELSRLNDILGSLSPERRHALKRDWIEPIRKRVAEIEAPVSRFLSQLPSSALNLLWDMDDSEAFLFAFVQKHHDALASVIGKEDPGPFNSWVSEHFIPAITQILQRDLPEERAILDLYGDHRRDEKVSTRPDRSPSMDRGKESLLERRDRLIDAYVRACEAFRTSAPTLEQLQEMSSLAKGTVSKFLSNPAASLDLKQALERKLNVAKSEERRDFWQKALEAVELKIADTAERIRKVRWLPLREDPPDAGENG